MVEYIYYCDCPDNDNLSDYAEYVNDNTPPLGEHNSPPQHNEHHQHDDPTKDNYYSDDWPHFHNDQGLAVYYDHNTLRLDHDYDYDRDTHSTVGDDGVDQWEGYRSEVSEE